MAAHKLNHRLLGNLRFKVKLIALISSDFRVIGMKFRSQFEYRSYECLFQALHYYAHLGEVIAVLLSVCMSWILAFGDCFTDSSLILVFVCKKCTILADFQSVDGSARWQASFNFNHTPQLVLYLVLVIADLRHSCCSACPVLQWRKYYVCCQKTTQILLPPKTDQ